MKWAPFTIGVMAGMIAVLFGVVLMQSRESLVYGTPLQDSAQQAGLLMGTGGPQQNQNDHVWILYKRPAKDDKSGTATRTGVKMENQITLALYKIDQGGSGTVSLVAARDCSYDLELVEYHNRPPHVREIKKELDDAQKKAKEGNEKNEK